MKIGIISFAHMHAYSYARALLQMDGAQFAGIADEEVGRGKIFADEFQVAFYPDYKQLLASDVDAVIVTSENVKHVQHVIDAAKAGKHILCEKPLATTIEDAQKMIAACRENGVILQTAFPVRFHPSVARAKKIVEEGKLGRILSIKGTNRGKNPGGWFVDPALSGGGAVMDHTVHVVDIMRWFMNSEVKEVYAEIGNLFTKTGIDDSGILTLEFENGVFATLDCSWSRPENFPTWGDVTLEIVGTEANLSLDAFAQKLDVYSHGSGLVWENWGDNMDVELIRSFIESVQNGTEPPITGEDGYKALEVALAAYESARKKESVTIGN